MREIAYLKRAWELFQTDDRRDTLLAVVIAVAVIGPIAYQIWKRNRR